MQSIIEIMLNQLFLSQLENLFSEKSINREKSPIWQFIIDVCQEHTSAIESIMQIGYTLDYGYLRETLSGDYPIIYLERDDLFEASQKSGKSDLIPCLVFSLPNDEKDKDKSDMRILRIEFGKPGMAGIDY